MKYTATAIAPSVRSREITDGAVNIEIIYGPVTPLREVLTVWPFTVVVVFVVFVTQFIVVQLLALVIPAWVAAVPYATRPNINIKNITKAGNNVLFLK
jgi:hypothetical protein